MSIGFGTRARIGQIYPSGGLCDYEPQMMAPPGVQFLTTRITFRKTGIEDDLALVAQVDDASVLLGDAKVDLIAFNCTAASLAAGPDAINSRIARATGIRSTTTIEAVLAAMAATRMKKIALITAYPDEVVQVEHDFFARQGFSVEAEAHHACTNPFDQGTTDPSRWRDLAIGLKDRNFDGLLISCAGIQVGAVLEEIEQILGRPVVTSNQSLIWHCMRLLGIKDPVHGFGSLLAGQHDAG
jgi:maleate isomerase